MMRKKTAFFIAFILVVSSLGADVFTRPADINFDIVVNKTGTQQLYFVEPGNWNVPKMDLNSFPLVSGEAQTVSIDLGVVWSIFPDSESASESIGVDIKLLASSASEYGQDGIDSYMLDLQKDSGSGVPLGLNYSIDVYGVDENGSQSDVVSSSLSIPGEDITTRLDRERRMLSLFKGTVTASGNFGKRVVKLTLNPPTTNEGKYFMEGDYEGYLILHVETF